MIVPLMKKDLYINGIYYLVIAVLTPIISLMKTPDYFVYVLIVIGFLFNLFYYDHRNHVNRFVGSLPVKRQNIVLSRYIMLLLFIVTYTFYVWFVNSLAHSGLPYLASQPMGPMRITILFTIINLIMAISIPIYYFNSFIKAVAIQMGCLVLGNFLFNVSAGYESFIFYPIIQLWLFDTIKIQPIIIMIAVSLFILYLSYLLSARIYIKKAKV